MYSNRKVILLAGLAYGDEGKGTMTEYLAVKNDARTVVRYCGGAQAAHNVITDDGRHHTFAQFGSATFHGVRTFLSKHMLVEPLGLIREARALKDKGVMNPFGLLTIDNRAPVVTPYHRAANRIRESARGDGRHGSCGIGIGETAADLYKYGRDAIITVRDLWDVDALADKLALVRANKIGELEQDGLYERDGDVNWDLMNKSVYDIANMYATFTDNVHATSSSYMGAILAQGNVVFEGSQGILLDQDYGFQPHTTWTNVTFDNAFQLLNEAQFDGEIEKVGVTRSYLTRHGAGPFVTEDNNAGFVENHNGTGKFQGAFRTGHLDLVALRYAIEVLGGIDTLAMTHMDVKTPKVCYGYDIDTQGIIDGFMKNYATIRVGRPALYSRQENLTRFLSTCKPTYTVFDTTFIASNLGTHLKYVSHGPKLSDKMERGKTYAAA